MDEVMEALPGDDESDAGHGLNIRSRMEGMLSPLPLTLTLHCRNTSRTWRHARHNDDMNIELNGQVRPLQPHTTVAALLLEEGLAQRRVAVEVNGTIVPRGAHAEHALRDGDRVEIVHALGGG